jgi:hypothetical protein
MGEVVKMNAERWAEVFDEAGLTVHVSTQGRVRFFVDDDTGDFGATLTMKQLMALTQTLGSVFTTPDDALEEQTGANDEG